MKAKLIKTDKGNYILIDSTKGVYDKGYHIGNSRECDVPKLSKQNCDEIFGVVDVEKLCKQEAEKLHDKSKHEDWDVYNCLVYEDTEIIKIGFNKAMELNKDKLFTLADMEIAISKSYYKGAEESYKGRALLSYDDVSKMIRSIELPAEIEVEIVMELNMNGKNAIDRSMYIPKLDSEGCLILKKI
jgi:hypothetical protein